MNPGDECRGLPGRNDPLATAQAYTPTFTRVLGDHAREMVPGDPPGSRLARAEHARRPVRTVAEENPYASLWAPIPALPFPVHNWLFCAAQPGHQAYLRTSEYSAFGVPFRLQQDLPNEANVASHGTRKDHAVPLWGARLGVASTTTEWYSVLRYPDASGPIQGDKGTEN